ncbi:FAD:protein FMN transferase [Novosphingobium terrae]|uniref:FAD:protein FMN transferase n=1 Tax=Novosphingobium terrae TaxID=2726189 RepID=UPI001F13868F|nr:FAD:protein FMN transferase [Novosphingobium terrae]
MEDELRIALPDQVDPLALRSMDADLPVTTLSGPTMGTTWRLHAVLPRGLGAARVTEVIEARLEALVAQMSHWEPQSALCRFNAAPAGHWQILPPAFAHVMQEALTIAEASEGAFSPAIGRLVDLWGFGPPGPVAQAPAPTAVAEALPPSDWRLLKLEEGRLYQPGGLSLDLSGIAKGYAADALAGDLAKLGVIHQLVEVGGELVGKGLRPDGQPWWVDLETPEQTGLPDLRVGLHGLAVATSGSYVRGLHNLDPRTGAPATSGVVACSVIHASAMSADGWASAFSVLDPHSGMALATRLGLAVRWVIRMADERFSEEISPALAHMLAQ